MDRYTLLEALGDDEWLIWRLGAIHAGRLSRRLRSADVVSLERDETDCDRVVVLWMRAGRTSRAFGLTDELGPNDFEMLESVDGATELDGIARALGLGEAAIARL